MKSPIGIKSVPADLIVFDELDEATPDAKTRAMERLSHSSYKRVIELSNPSLPDYGIDEAYRATDQRHWFNKCPRCNQWTSLVKEFPKALNEEVRVLRVKSDDSVYRACPQCDAELDPDQGEWVPEYPDRESRGYLISQLFSSAVDPGDILRDYHTTRFPDRFYNLKVGIPWVDRANRLHPDEILALCGAGDLRREGLTGATMGVDTGRDLHTVISVPLGDDDFRRRVVVHIGAHRSFEVLDKLIQVFGVVRCVIDGLPETHATRAFAQRHPGIVFLNFFNEHQRGIPKWDFESFTVQENRTEALDQSRRAIREGWYRLPRRDASVEEFARHLCNDAKQLQEDPDTGQQRYRYVRTGPNHYSMALTYDCLAVGDSQPLMLPVIA